MKLQDITLNQIKDYFEECEYDGLIKVELINNDEYGEVLELYRFDGEYDDEVFLCKIYHDRDGDFIVETETNLSPLNFGNGFIHFPLYKHSAKLSWFIVNESIFILLILYEIYKLINNLILFIY